MSEHVSDKMSEYMFDQMPNGMGNPGIFKAFFLNVF